MLDWVNLVTIGSNPMTVPFVFKTRIILNKWFIFLVVLKKKPISLFLRCPVIGIITILPYYLPLIYSMDLAHIMNSTTT